MPTYCWKCKSCDSRSESTDIMPKRCEQCGELLYRDYKEEGVANDFHPTTDIYWNSKKKKGTA